MTKGTHLGEFELYVMAALLQLGDEAYGGSIRDQIETRAARSASIGTVYATLARLAEKGYVTFWTSEPIPVRGGRARKHVRLTDAGQRAFRASSRSLANMLRDLEPTWGRGTR